MKTIGSRIAAAREAKGLNQSELARLLSISPQSVQAWEADRNTPRPKRLGEIATALGVSMASLMGEPEAPAVAAAEPQAGAAAKVLEMLKKHGKGLTPEAQQKISTAVAETLATPSNVVTGDFQRPARLTDGDILIPQYDVRASMGHGQMPSDYVEFMRNVVVSGPQLEKLGLDFTSPANLSIITGWGQSMAPTIQDKDPVIVDRGVTEFSGDAIYVLTWQDHLFIKRVHLAGGGKLKIISDSRPDDPETVTPDEISIHAKVLLVWNGRKL